MTKTAILEIQEGCNQACVFCLEDDVERPAHTNPTTEQVGKLLADLRERGAEHITFMGGETFFRKDLPLIVAEARRLGFSRIGVTTNGSIVSKIGYLRQQIAAGLDYIEFSLHGHTPEIANAIARANSFSRQAIALGQLNELALPTIFNVVVCEENRAHLLGIAQYVTESFPRIPGRFKFKFVALTGRAASEARVHGRALRYEDVDIKPAADYLTERNVPFWFDNFPLCRLDEHADSSHELGLMAADEQFFNRHLSDASYRDSGHQLTNRVRPEASCASCSVRAICPGLEHGYVAYGAAQALRARHDDPLPLLQAALRKRSVDPALAAERLAFLATRADSSPPPKPATRPGELLFSHPAAPHRLKLELTALEPDKKAFLQTAHFALSYASWPSADPYQRPEVVALLQAAGHAVAEADEAGAAVEAASAAIVAVARHGGWQQIGA